MRFLSLLFISTLILTDSYAYRRDEMEKVQTEKKDEKPKKSCKKNSGVFFVADFLYWKIRNNSWIFALNPTYEKLTSPIYTKYDTMRPDYKLEPGLRIGMGYSFSHDTWDIYADWTYTHSKTKSSFVSDDKKILISTFAGSVDIGSLSGKWDLDYHTWDIECGRSFHPGIYFSWRPFIGIRGTYFKQIFHTYAADPDDDTPTSQQIFPLSVKAHDQFWGVGIRAGLDAKVQFCNYFGLFGKVSGAILYGEVDAPNILTTNIGQAPNLPDNAGETHLDIKNKYYESKPTAQIMLGLEGGSGFCNNSKYFGIKAAFEINYWWDQENSHTLGMSRDYGTPLEFAGLTISARLEF